MLKIPGEGECQIVTHDEVEHLTALGYTLLGMYQEQSAEVFYDTEPDPSASYQGQTISTSRYHPVTKTFFIMQLGSDEALQRATVARQQAETARDEAQAEAREAETQRAVTEQDKAEALAQVTHTDRRNASLGEQLKEHRESNQEYAKKHRTLKADMAKVRRVIGDREWAKIMSLPDES